MQGGDLQQPALLKSLCNGTLVPHTHTDTSVQSKQGLEISLLPLSTIPCFGMHTGQGDGPPGGLTG